MSKGQREPEPSSVQLTSRRRRGATATWTGVAPGDKSAFMNAFADALRDILRDERRRAA